MMDARTKRLRSALAVAVVVIVAGVVAVMVVGGKTTPAKRVKVSKTTPAKVITTPSKTTSPSTSQPTTTPSKTPSKTPLAALSAPAPAPSAQVACGAFFSLLNSYYWRQPLLSRADLEVVATPALADTLAPSMRETPGQIAAHYGYSATVLIMGSSGNVVHVDVESGTIIDQWTCAAVQSGNRWLVTAIRPGFHASAG